MVLRVLHNQSQPVYPAAVWQEIDKDLLHYQKPTEQLVPPGCEIPQLILPTTPNYFCDFIIYSSPFMFYGWIK